MGSPCLYKRLRVLIVTLDRSLGLWKECSRVSEWKVVDEELTWMDGTQKHSAHIIICHSWHNNSCSGAGGGGEEWVGGHMNLTAGENGKKNTYLPLMVVGPWDDLNKDAEQPHSSSWVFYHVLASAWSSWTVQRVLEIRKTWGKSASVVENKLALCLHTKRRDADIAEMPYLCGTCAPNSAKAFLNAFTGWVAIHTPPPKASKELRSLPLLKEYPHPIKHYSVFYVIMRDPGKHCTRRR